MRKFPRILVAGGSGQVAQCLTASAQPAKATLVALGRPELDIGDPASIESALDRVNPTVVINAAAYTAVDKAESEPAEAFRVNCAGAAHLAAASRKRGLPFIHISTDYVFDGTAESPYPESFPTNPLGVYGKSKRDGEQEVLTAHPDAVILRTSWVYSAYGANFVKTMMRLAQSHPVVRVVDDQRGSPTSAHDLAAALLEIAEALDGNGVPRAGGIYHLTADGQTSWHGFAWAIFSELDALGMRIPQLAPIKTSEYPTPAQRPAYSVLDCSKAEHTFGVRLPPWRQSIANHIRQFAIEREAQTC